jgi:hypothetical protein
MCRRRVRPPHAGAFGFRASVEVTSRSPERAMARCVARPAPKSWSCLRAQGRSIVRPHDAPAVVRDELIGWTTSHQPVVHSFETVSRRLPGSGSDTAVPNTSWSWARKTGFPARTMREEHPRSPSGSNRIPQARGHAPALSPANPIRPYTCRCSPAANSLVNCAAGTSLHPSVFRPGHRGEKAPRPGLSALAQGDEYRGGQGEGKRRG